MSKLSQRAWKCVGLAHLLLVLTGVVGCSRYSALSPEAYQYTKALYSVCNRHDQLRLTSVAQQIDTARAESLLTAHEADWLDEIIVIAQAGNWQEATRKARLLMEAQVEGR